MGSGDVKQKKTILCNVAGKSGGHIIPCLTLAARQKEKDPTLTVAFFTTSAPLDSKIIAQSAVDMHTILPLTNLAVGKQLWRIPGTVWHLLKSLYISWRQLRSYKNKYATVRAVSTGGFIALPVCFWAVIFKIPIDLYELNVVPGKATAWLARWATNVYVCFAKTKQFFPHAQVVDYPVRFAHQAPQVSRADACAALNFDATRKTIFVIGGSQGSVALNTMIKHIVQRQLLDATTIQIIHQTGAADIAYWHQLYAQHGVPAIVFDYCDELLPYYRAADLVISRAGSGMLFELLYLGKQTIIIPLETTVNNHQLYNAQEMVAIYPQLFTLIRSQEIERDFGVLGREIQKLLKI
jgi:UDP-N-acetylglucosamine--N-acetylmuramyl-(pentapeptide) pyrophosphoryl-undecaprenol N-acetylglucosamine transferase